MEEATRCDFYARHEVAAVAGPLSEWVELISPQRERTELRARVPGVDETHWHGPAIQDSLAELQDDYAQAMRVATLGYLLHSRPFRLKMSPLGLPPPPPPPTPPEIGVVTTPPHDFAGVLTEVQQLALGAAPQLLACQLGVHLESLWMRDAVLVQDDLALLELPSSLANFCSLQATKLDEIVLQLRYAWVEAAESALQERLEVGHSSENAEYAEAASARDAYEAGRLPRLLRLLALRMQSELHSLVLSSMAAYLRLLHAFATPDSELQPLSVPPAEWVHALPPAQPALLAVSLVLREDGGLDFEPPLAAVEEALAATLEALPVETAGVPSLAPRVFNCWGLDRLDEEPLSSLHPDGPPVLEARAALRRMLRASLERPQQLLEVFGAFAELGAISIPEHLAAVEARGCDLAAYADEIAKWRQTAELVRAAAPSEVHCRLLLVHCAALQAELEAKAHELAAGVAELVVAELAAASLRISESYAAIYERLQQVTLTLPLALTP